MSLQFDEVQQNLKHKKLTDWENEPSIVDLKADFEAAKVDHQSHVNDVVTWLDNLNVTGSAKLTKVKNKSSVQPKLIRKQAEWRYASLTEPFLSTPDIFDVSPVTWEDKDGAYQNKLVLNNQFNTKLNKIKLIDEYIRTAVDEGTVICRVGWDYEDEEVDEEVPIFSLVPVQDPNMLAQHEQLHQLMQQDPQQFQSLPPEMQEAHALFMDTGMQQVQTGSRMETVTKIIKNQPVVEICDYNNVIVDPTCQGDLDKASFIIFSFETSLSELKKDGKYTNLDNIRVSTESPLNDPDYVGSDEEPTFTFKDKPRAKIVAYEYWGYWDIDNTGIVKPFVATYVGDTVIRMEESPFPDNKLPFVVTQYLPVRKSIYGEPDGALLEDNQKVTGAVTRGMIDIMARSANGQMGVRKDALDVTNRRKFNAGLDYEFNANVDPRQAMYMHTFPEIPKSAEYMLNLQNLDAEALTGVKAFHTGISGQTLGSTATAARGALDAASKRELGILRRLAEGLKQIARKIIAMNAEFLSEEEIVRITNEEFIPIRRDDLAGNYDLELSISTPETDNQKAQELAFMLQTMGNNLPFEMSQMILSDIAKLRRMPNLAKQISEYQPQPDPMAQQKAQLELALLQAQVNNEQAKAEENATDVNLKRAKTETELAKSRNLHSKSDQQDLDFLEQESGVSQDREIEKQNIQGDLKAREKILDGYIKANTGGVTHNL